jgi:hypothetical protein
VLDEDSDVKTTSTAPRNLAGLLPEQPRSDPTRAAAEYRPRAPRPLPRLRVDAAPEVGSTAAPISSLAALARARVDADARTTVEVTPRSAGPEVYPAALQRLAGAGALRDPRPVRYLACQRRRHAPSNTTAPSTGG